MKKIVLHFVLFTGLITFSQNTHQLYIENGYVINGYDVVAYFSNKALEGDKANYSYKYDGVLFAFANLENLNTFKLAPEKYLPEYGGHCSYAMAVKGSKISPDPKVFEIRDGRLHLFHRQKGLDTWLEKGPKTLRAQADVNWAKFFKK